MGKNISRKNTPPSIPQGMATRKLYTTEQKIIENIWDMSRPRSLSNIQKLLESLWKQYSVKYNVTRSIPEVRFGSGIRYNGRYLSYTMAREVGEPWLIELAPGERNYYVLVHELVHALGPIQHGVRFAEIYHDILSNRVFKKSMNHELGKKFLSFLKTEHPRYVRYAYRNR